MATPRANTNVMIVDPIMLPKSGRATQIVRPIRAPTKASLLNVITAPKPHRFPTRNSRAAPSPLNKR
jgi:hypothetical protein